MINEFTAIICAMVLMIAAILEIAAERRMIGFLTAFGFLMLAARYFYLIQTEDLGRLNLYGTGSIGAIALARIIACTDDLKFWR